MMCGGVLVRRGFAHGQRLEGIVRLRVGQAVCSAATGVGCWSSMNDVHIAARQTWSFLVQLGAFVGATRAASVTWRGDLRSDGGLRVAAVHRRAMRRFAVVLLLLLLLLLLHIDIKALVAWMHLVSQLDSHPARDMAVPATGSDMAQLEMDILRYHLGPARASVLVSAMVSNAWQGWRHWTRASL